jgi:pimeloyl-ACP methyl ester carboxylesterase
MLKQSLKFILSFLTGIFLSSCALTPKPSAPTAVPGYDADLTGYKYPYDIHSYGFEAQNQKLQMTYMELIPAKTTPPVIVLLHGKNFGGYAFDKVAGRLLTMGYRVFVPDQIGFGKSSKPAHFQYSLQALASMTNQLLESKGITNYILVGHSMGGMLALRMALMYPEKISKLVLVNPIGLEDWRLLTPSKSVDALYQEELKSTPESIKKYQMESYYSGEWKPEYEHLIEAASGWTKHPDFPLVAWNAALTTDMAYTQPVIYELKNIKIKTAMIIGQNDKTAIGRAWAPEENKSKMGLYPQLGRQAAKLIPGAKLYELKGLGHVPFVENIDRFFAEGLIPALDLK